MPRLGRLTPVPPHAAPAVWLAHPVRGPRDVIRARSFLPSLAALAALLTVLALASACLPDAPPESPSASPAPASAQPTLLPAAGVPTTTDPPVRSTPTEQRLASAPIATSASALDVPATTSPRATPVPPPRTAPPPTPPAPPAPPAPPPTPTPAGPPKPRQIGNVPPPLVTAKAVAVLDEASGQLLHAINERAQVAPASITKIATGLVALERPGLDLERFVDVTVDASEMLVRDGSQVMGLEPGERVKLRTLLYGLLLWSGNDAAEQIALSLTGGNRQQFVDWMNQKVAALGLQNTHFVNPSGMDAPGHYSSALDMALLGRAAMQNPLFRTIVGSQSYKDDGYPIPNINRFLLTYPGADGIKTGFTDDAGRTMVASATQNGRRVYVALMHSDDLVADSTKLFDWTWKNFDFGPRP